MKRLIQRLTVARFLVVSLLFVLYVNNAATAADPTRPNILVLIADDASRTSFGAYGSRYVQTPHFDRIAREGCLFTQAYNCNPKCAPARACLLTGRYSWQLQEACNHNPFLSERWVFYPFLLESAGYDIGYTGKGWGPGIWKGIDVGRTHFTQVNPAGHPFIQRTRKPPYSGMSHTDYAANFADFLDQRSPDQPFCFWLGTREPHRRYELNSWKKAGRDLNQVTVQSFFPDNDVVRGDLADYALEVEWYDEHIGRCLQLLEQHELLDSTLIIATSDHGMPFPRVKGQIYDEGFHVPFAVRWGDRISPGRVVTDFVSFADLAPTLLELTGTPRHEQMTGHSFAPQLLAEASGRIDAARDHTLLGKERHDIGRTDGDRLSVGYPSRALRNDDWLYVRNLKPHRWPAGNPELGLANCDRSPTKTLLTQLSHASDDYQYYELAFGKRPEEELYDMRNDPDCVHNLADDRQHAELKAQLWSQLQAELIAQRDPRMLGSGDIFDAYPNCRIERQRELYGVPDFDPVGLFQKAWEQPAADEVNP